MDLTDLVVDAGVEQDSLSGGRLARVDMRHDPDVPDLGEFHGGLSGHVFRFLVLSRLPPSVVLH
jgi:hypothetical protein